VRKPRERVFGIAIGKRKERKGGGSRRNSSLGILDLLRGQPLLASLQIGHGPICFFYGISMVRGGRGGDELIFVSCALAGLTPLDLSLIMKYSTALMTSSCVRRISWIWTPPKRPQPRVPICQTQLEVIKGVEYLTIKDKSNGVKHRKRATDLKNQFVPPPFPPAPC